MFLMSLTLGKFFLGEKGAQEAAETLQDGQGGGSIILGKHFRDREEKKKAAAVAASGNATAARKTATAPGVNVPVAPVAPAAASLTEEEVAVALASDPNDWLRIVELETARPEGPRIAVAQLLLAAAPKMTTRPMPDEVYAELERIAAQLVTTEE